MKRNNYKIRSWKECCDYCKEVDYFFDIFNDILNVKIFLNFCQNITKIQICI